MNEREKMAQVLADGANALRRLEAERDSEREKRASAEEKLAAVMVRLEAEKLAAEAHEAGTYQHLSFPDLVDYFEKAAQEGRLPVIKEAMVARPPDMGGQFKISNDESRASGVSELEQFLVGNVG